MFYFFLSYYISIHDLAHLSNAVYHVLFDLKKFGDFLKNYRVCCDLYDEQLHQSKGDAQAFFLQPNDELIYYCL